jgi:hypothetical protein
MMAFNSLPEELIDKIVADFKGDHCEIGTMFNISLVSKKLHRIVEPNLYYLVDIDFNTTASDGALGTVHLLARTLISRPDLAKYVQELVARKPSTCIGDDPDWANEIQCDASLDSLCQLLPNISTLWARHYLWEDVDTLSHRFPTLKRVNIALPPSYPILQLSHLFSLPSIEMIALHGGEVSDASEPDEYGTPKYTHEWVELKSRLQHLLLDRTATGRPHSGLQLLARACAALKSLELVLDVHVAHSGPKAVEQLRAFENHFVCGSLTFVEVSLYNMGLAFTVQTLDHSRVGSPPWYLGSGRQWDQLVLYNVGQQRNNQDLASSLRYLDLHYLGRNARLINQGFFLSNGVLQRMMNSAYLTIGIDDCVEPERILEVETDTSDLELGIDFYPDLS